MSSIVGNVYDDTDLARDTAKGEDGFHDPLGCGQPWPWWCVLAVNERGDALLAPVVMEPLREAYDHKAGAFRYRAAVFVPDLGATVTCIMSQEAHRPVSVVTESGKRWHVLAGCGHWHPALGLQDSVIDRILPDHVRATYRAAQADGCPSPEDEQPG